MEHRIARLEGRRPTPPVAPAPSPTLVLVWEQLTPEERDDLERWSSPATATPAQLAALHRAEGLYLAAVESGS